MRIWGLTGGIASGKSTIAAMVRRAQIPVFDADRHVHDLMRQDTALINQIRAAFPDAWVDGQIDRRALGRTVFADPQQREKLESLIHPRVRQAEHAFIFCQQRQRRRTILLDIPLLFESGADALCDRVAVTLCPPFIQAQRALRRTGMTREKLRQILEVQLSDEERLCHADLVIQTGNGLHHAMRQLHPLLMDRI